MRRSKNHTWKELKGDKEQYLFSIPDGPNLGFLGLVVGKQAGEVSERCH